MPNSRVEPIHIEEVDEEENGDRDEDQNEEKEEGVASPSRRNHPKVVNDAPQQGHGDVLADNAESIMAALQRLPTQAHQLQTMPTMTDVSQMSQGRKLKDELTTLQHNYDLTRARMRKLYNAFDANGDGTLTYEEFREGLRMMNVRWSTEEEFQTMISITGIKHTGDNFPCEEFEKTVRLIKLRELLPLGNSEKTGQQTKATAYDYSPDSICEWENLLKDPTTFFLSEFPSWATVRWVDIDDKVDTLTMRQLAVKYCLHPLAVQDTIEDDKRPKFEKYEEHLFMVVPMLMLSEVGNKENNKDTNQQNPEHTLQMDLSELSIVPEMVSIFLVPSDNTLITVQEAPGDVWARTRKHLALSYSKLRQNGINFLLYTLLDSNVGFVAGLMDKIVGQLDDYEEQIHKTQREGKYNPPFGVEKVYHLKRQMAIILRMVKPMKDVVMKLAAEPDISSDDTTAKYMDSVVADLQVVIADLESSIEACKAIIDQYTSLRESHMNKVMYLLAIVTTMFIPMQLATGLYGMNFSYMPELNLDFGYLYFWILVITSMLGVRWKLKRFVGES